MTEFSDADAQAIRAHNEQLDDDWAATRDAVAPEEVTWPRGVYTVPSVAHAFLPPQLVQEVLDAHREVKPTKDGLWLFLPETTPETDNLVMRVGVRSKGYFDTYWKERDLTIDRIATPGPAARAAELDDVLRARACAQLPLAVPPHRVVGRAVGVRAAHLHGGGVGGLGPEAPALHPRAPSPLRPPMKPVVTSSPDE